MVKKKSKKKTAKAVFLLHIFFESNGRGAQVNIFDASVCFSGDCSSIEHNMHYYLIALIICFLTFDIHLGRSVIMNIIFNRHWQKCSVLNGLGLRLVIFLKKKK